MGDDIRARWDDSRRQQFTAVTTTVFGLAAGALYYCASLLTADKITFGGLTTKLFVSSVVCFIVSMFFGFIVNMTRLISFRLTARLIRVRDSPQRDESRLACLRHAASKLDTASWLLLYMQIASFLAGILFLLVDLSRIFHDKLYPT